MQVCRQMPAALVVTASATRADQHKHDAVEHKSPVIVERFSRKPVRRKLRRFPQTNPTTTNMVLPARVFVKPVSSFIPRPHPWCVLSGVPSSRVRWRVGSTALDGTRVLGVALMLHILASLPPNMPCHLIPMPSFCRQVMGMCTTSLRSFCRTLPSLATFSAILASISV